MYKLDEEDLLNDYDLGDWFEFVRNIQKSKLERELDRLTNAKLFKNNFRLLRFFRVSLKEFNNFLKYVILKNFKNSYNLSPGSSKILELVEYYQSINFTKFKKLKNNEYYQNSGNMLMMVDMRKSKPRIFLISKDKCILSLTSGIVYKKLELKQKKIKKTEKMLNLMLKAVSSSINKWGVLKNFLIHLKGTRSNIFNVLVLIEKNFKNKNISLLYSPHISFGNFKFKKVKSIKRRLRKKFSRLIKN